MSDPYQDLLPEDETLTQLALLIGNQEYVQAAAPQCNCAGLGVAGILIPDPGDPLPEDYQENAHELVASIKRTHPTLREIQVIYDRASLKPGEPPLAEILQAIKSAPAEGVTAYTWGLDPTLEQAGGDGAYWVNPSHPAFLPLPPRETPFQADAFTSANPESWNRSPDLDVVEPTEETPEETPKPRGFEELLSDLARQFGRDVREGCEASDDDTQPPAEPDHADIVEEIQTGFDNLRQQLDQIAGDINKHVTTTVRALANAQDRCEREREREREHALQDQLRAAVQKLADQLK